MINKIRVYKKELGNIKEAVDCAVDECIQEGILMEFLEKHRGDVMANVLTEFNEEVFVRGIKEEGRQESLAIFVETLREFGIADDVIVQKIMEKYDMSQEEANKYLK